MGGVFCWGVGGFWCECVCVCGVGGGSWVFGVFFVGDLGCFLWDCGFFVVCARAHVCVCVCVGGGGCFGGSL